MTGYIDMHAHILPGADHGSTGLDMSLSQLALAEQCGVGTVAATSHFYPDARGSNRFVERRDQAYAALTQAYRGAVRILPGAEVLLCQGLENHPQLDSLCIGSSRVLLTEMPPPPWPRRYEETLLALREERGLTVLLAHVERYPRREMEHLLDLGFYGQVNAGSLLRPLLRRRLLHMIDQGSVIALGSDVHGLSRAYQDYQRAARRLGQGNDRLQAAMSECLQL